MINTVFAFCVICNATYAGDKIEVLCFPEEPVSEIGKAVTLHLQVKNLSSEVIVVPGGKADRDGKILPFKYDISGTLYTKSNGLYARTVKWSDGKSITDSDSNIEVKPGGVVIYRIDCVPFDQEHKGEYCKITIRMFGLEPKIAYSALVFLRK